MLNEFLFTKIEVEDIGNIWFQQEGATYHTAEPTFDVLRHVFEDRNISRRADVVGLLFVGCCQIEALKVNIHEAITAARNR